MKYFNGFSLKNEEVLFSSYLFNSESLVVGFSYGAQKAFEYAYNATHRIDRLILLSPAFFQAQKSSFIRTQLIYFDSSKESYVKQFLKNVIYPSSLDLSEYVEIGTKDELEELLNYVWDKDKLDTLLSRGVKIEVFLGEDDKIIDVKDAQNFFSKKCITYTIKNSGHILR